MQEQIGNHEHRSEPATPMRTDPVSVYFEAGGVIVTLILLGQVLELRARNATAQPRQVRAPNISMSPLAPPTKAAVAAK